MRVVGLHSRQELWHSETAQTHGYQPSLNGKGKRSYQKAVPLLNRMGAQHVRAAWRYSGSAEAANSLTTEVESGIPRGQGYRVHLLECGFADYSGLGRAALPATNPAYSEVKILSIQETHWRGR